MFCDPGFCSGVKVRAGDRIRFLVWHRREDNQSSNQSINQSIEQPINPPTNQRQPTNKEKSDQTTMSPNQSTNQSTTTNQTNNQTTTVCNQPTHIAESGQARLPYSPVPSIACSLARKALMRRVHFSLPTSFISLKISIFPVSCKNRS